MGAFAAFAYLVTVVAAAFLLFRQQQLTGQDPVFARMLVWQACVYGLWLPFGLFVWFMFRRSSATPAAIARFLLIGLVAVPVHAVGATFVDIAFSRPGSADLVALAAERAQLDLLIYAAFGLLAVAAAFRRRAEQEAAAAAALSGALEIARSALADSPNSQAGDAERLMVSVGAKRVLVQTDEVEWFGSAGNYVVVNWQGREGLIRQTLQSLEQRLDPQVFVRIHRSTIVNLARVEGTQSLSDGSWRLSMASGAELVASRTYRDRLLGRLKGSDFRP